MTEATAVMPGSERATAEKTTDAIMHSARRLWLAGLGTVAVAAEQVQIAFETLGNKGETIEPTVVAPFRWASETANSLAQRAGQSVKNMGSAVNSATASATAGVAGVGRRFKAVDMSEEVSRIVDEKLSAALKELDLVSRDDLQAVADRIEEMLPKSKRGRESHAD
jgi:polyhydroxyalkanoate synthesis regulator phasin